MGIDSWHAAFEFVRVFRGQLLFQDNLVTCHRAGLIELVREIEID